MPTGKNPKTAAIDPGLVYDSGFLDWFGFLCGTGQLVSGVVMFEMVAGRRPFPSRTVQAILHSREPLIPPNPSTLRQEIPESLSRAILRCLEENPCRRFSSATELRRALEG